MTKTQTKKCSAFKLLALALLSAMAFLVSMGPASATTSPLTKGSLTDALTPSVGPDAARSVARQMGEPSASTGRHLYFVACIGGVGTVYVLQVGGTHAEGFANFACSGDWYNEGSFG